MLPDWHGTELRQKPLTMQDTNRVQQACCHRPVVPISASTSSKGLQMCLLDHGILHHGHHACSLSAIHSLLTLRYAISKWFRCSRFRTSAY